MSFLLSGCSCTRVGCRYSGVVKYRVDSESFHVFSVVKRFIDMHRFSDFVFDSLVPYHFNFQRKRDS